MPAAGPGFPPEPGRPPAGDGDVAAPAPAVLRLKRRAEFKAASRGARWHAAPFSLQAVDRPPGDPGPTVGVGFTTTKRLGGAVVRNRIRRRLREAARAALPGGGARPGTNYVLLARPAALSWAFSDLVNELRRGLPAVTRKLARGAGPAGGPPRGPS